MFTQAPTPRAEGKRRTRAAVLDAARALFAERGFERTTIRDVAERAGIAVGTVFVHFPDKAALLTATLDEQLEATLSRAWSTLPEGTARARLGHVVAALYRMYARSPVLSRVLVKESLFVEDREGVQAARLAAFAQALHQIIVAREARGLGALRPGLDAKDAVAAVFATYIACLVEGLTAPRFDVRKQVARFDRLIAPWFRDGALRRKGGRR